MMNKIQKLSLKDYLNDPTDIRLRILVRAINPEFPITKSATNDIKLILEDYRSDNSPSRLKLIESYVGGNDTRHAKAIKPSKSVSATIVPSAKLTELNVMCQEFAKLFSNTGLSEERRKHLRELEVKIATLSEELGFNKTDPDAQIKNEISLVKSILGDWNTQGTYAWELIHGNRSTFEIRNQGKNRVIEGFNMNEIMRYLAKHSGQRIRNFKAQFVMAPGSNGAGWLFKENWDGNQTLEDNALSVNGQSISVKDIMAVPDLGNMQTDRTYYSE